MFTLSAAREFCLHRKLRKKNPDISGLVSLAGSPRRLEDIILDQNKAAISAMNIPGADKQALLDKALGLVDQVKALRSESPHQTIFTMNSEYWLSLNLTNPQSIVNTLANPHAVFTGRCGFSGIPRNGLRSLADPFEGK